MKTFVPPCKLLASDISLGAYPSRKNTKSNNFFMLMVQGPLSSLSNGRLDGSEPSTFIDGPRPKAGDASRPLILLLGKEAWGGAEHLWLRVLMIFWGPKGRTF